MLWNGENLIGDLNRKLIQNVRTKIHSRQDFFAFEGKSFLDGDAAGRHERGSGHRRDADCLGRRGGFQEPDPRQGHRFCGSDSCAVA